jgi:Zn-dependent M28 family amino/carboxypeptidase
MLKIILHGSLKITILLIFSFSTLETMSQNKAQLIQDLKILSSDEMEGRKPGTTGHKIAQEYIIKRFDESGVVPYYKNYSDPFEINLAKEKVVLGENIIGKINGRSDKAIVLSAHYDHLGIRDGKIYFGADDNASGVAALFYIADYFNRNKPNHTLIFTAFDGEESGLKGAQYFVRNLKDQEVILNVNMDMISRSDSKEIYACGTRYSADLKPILQTVSNSNPKVSLKFGHDGLKIGEQDWTYNSDHGPFHKKGIPFIYFGVEDHPDYHHASDTFDKIDADFYSNVVGMILDFVKEMDNKN